MTKYDEPSIAMIPLPIRQRVAQRVFGSHWSELPDDRVAAMRVAGNSSRYVCADGLCILGAIFAEVSTDQVIRDYVFRHNGHEGYWQGPSAPSAAVLLRALFPAFAEYSQQSVILMASWLITKNDSGLLDTPEKVRAALLLDEEAQDG